MICIDEIASKSHCLLFGVGEYPIKIAHISTKIQTKFDNAKYFYTIIYFIFIPDNVSNSRA